MNPWMSFVLLYAIFFAVYLIIDWIYARAQKRRQAKILTSRLLVLLREFAEGKRVA